MRTHIVNMAWARMWGTSCDLLKRDLKRSLHVQKATLFGFLGVSADDACAGLARLHGCACIVLQC